MRPIVLALRITRRAVAAATVQDDDLTFHDARHVSSKKERALAGAERYITRLMDVTKPTFVMLDSPHTPRSTTSQVLEIVTGVLARLHVPWEMVSVSDILSSFGQPGVRSRRELVRVIEPFWPALAQLSSNVKPYVADAAAAALYGDVRHGLGQPTPA
jgi:hypothetical protein